MIFWEGYTPDKAEQLCMAGFILKNTLNIPEQDIDIVSLGFPQVLLTMDAPLDAIIKLWHEAKPSAPFRKINVDEILFLYGYAYKERYFYRRF